MMENILKDCKQGAFLYNMIAAHPDSHGNPCVGCCYTINECKHSKTVSAGCSSYKIVEGEIPVVRAWCKDCSKESAIPTYNVVMNGKAAIYLKCNCCNNGYVMYKDDYTRKYLGFTNGYGVRIQPSRDGIRKEKPTSRELQRREQSRMDLWTNTFGLSEAEAKEKIKELDERRQKERERFNKKWEKEKNAFAAKIRDEELNKKSATRKELIAQGILKFDKANRCLINTQTGEIVEKL